MQRISTSTKVTDMFGVGKHGWRDGNLALGIQPTDAEATWFNEVQEEISNVIEGAGIALSGATRTQLYDAVQVLIGNAVAALVNQDYKSSVRFATIGNIVLSGLGTQAGGDWSAALNPGDRILPKDQITGTQNGIYIAAAGAWIRSTDADGAGEVTPGMQVTVEEGTLADSIWELATDGAITIGTTALTFARKDAGASLGIPVGACISFPATSPPTGYVKRNGALLSRTTYAALWAFAQASGNLAASDGVWQTGQFSPGDGSTTFRIPEARGEFDRNWDDGRGVDAGRALGSAQDDRFQDHAHGTVGGAGVSGDGGSYGIYAGASAAGSGLTNGAYRSGTETRPRNVALLACIKY